MPSRPNTSSDLFLVVRAPPKFELVIHSWDIGATIDGNPSVCTKWGVAADSAGRDNIYLTDVARLKLELPDVRAAIKTHDKRDKPNLIAIDHRGAGIGVYQELRKAGYRHLYYAGDDGSPMTAKSIGLERRFSTCMTGSLNFLSLALS